MEKLKVKHDHKLTDILKVGIFAIFLLLPFLTWLPSGLYYAFNEHAVTENETIEKYETKQVNFNQGLQKWTNNNMNNWQVYYASYYLDNENAIYLTATSNNDATLTYQVFNYNINDIYQVNYFAQDSNYSVNIGIDLLDSSSPNYEIFGSQQIGLTLNKYSLQFTPSHNSSNGFSLCFRFYAPTNDVIKLSNINLFNLTQMFGSGKEPTIQQFNEIYTKDDYEYTQSKVEIIDIPTGETTTYTNISNQLVYNWQSMWNSPLFYWTNVSILNTGLTNFCNILGINTTAYITNLITYELIIVTIYIVIDIVLTLFKWLTHMVGSKE